MRFYHGSAPLLEAAELIIRLETMMDELGQRKEEAEQSRLEAERGKEEAQQRADRLARQLRELGVDPDES